MHPINRYLYEVDGRLYWKEIPKKYNCAKVGDRAGSSHHTGYLYIRLAGKAYPQHHVVWFLHNGSFPELEIDHIDGDKSNNRISNLRLATRSQNARNMKSRGGTSKFVGVSWKTRDRRWVVQCLGKSGGSFLCEKEAGLSYNYMAGREYGEFARFNKVFEDVSDEVLSVET